MRWNRGVEQSREARLALNGPSALLPFALAPIESFFGLKDEPILPASSTTNQWLSIVSRRASNVKVKKRRNRQGYDNMGRS